MTVALQSRILIAAYAGFGNAGDELIVASMLAQLRALRPAVHFTVLSGNPPSTVETHGVEAVSWHDIDAMITAIRTSDLVVLGGGGLFQDYWGTDPDLLFEPEAWGLPMFAAPALLAALEGRPLMLYALGVGPLSSGVGRRLTCAVAEAAACVTVRDAASAAVLAELGVTAHVTADPAFAPPGGLVQGAAQTEAVLGVALRGWSLGVDESYWRREMAEALDRFIERGHGSVRLLVLQQPQPGEAGDMAAAGAVRALMRHPDSAEVVSCTEFSGLGAEIARCRWLCAMRLHAIVLAAQASVPFVAISYDPKVAALAQSLGAGSRLLNLDSLDAASLDAQLCGLAGGGAALDAAIGERCAQLAGAARENARLAVELLDHPAVGRFGADAQSFVARSVARAAHRRVIEQSHAESLRAGLEELRATSVQLQTRLENTRARARHLSAALDSAIAGRDAAQQERDELRDALKLARHRVADLENALCPHEDPRLAAILKRGVKVVLDLIAWCVPSFIRHAVRPLYLRAIYYPLFPERRPRAAAGVSALKPEPSGALVRSAYTPFIEFKSNLYRNLPLDFSLVSVACRRGLVSVVLPVYNGERYVREAIDAVLAQTYPDFELIVVDDGSTDSTPAILAAYASHPRVRLIRQANQKLPATLNAGFRAACGEYLTWTSHDNAYYPHALAGLVAYLEAHRDVEMVYADEDIIGENGEPVLDSSFCPGYQNPPGSNHINWPYDPGELNFVRNNYIGSHFLYRAWAARIAGDYDTACFGYEDYDYWMRMNALFRLAHLGSRPAMGRYRLHPESLSSHARELAIVERASRHMYTVAGRMECMIEPQDVTLCGLHPWFMPLAAAYGAAGHNVHLSPDDERFRLTRSAPHGLIVCSSDAVAAARRLAQLQPSTLVELGQPGLAPAGSLDWSVRAAHRSDTAIEGRREIEAGNPSALAFPLLAVELAARAALTPAP